MILPASFFMMMKMSFWVALPKETNMLQEEDLLLEIVPLVSGFDLFFISLLWSVMALTFILVNTMTALLSFFLQRD